MSDEGTRPERSAAQGATLIVEGRGKLLIGLRAILEPGQTVAFGRSRSCPLSLRRSPAFAAAKDPVAMLASTEFNRISRIHFEITHQRDGRVLVRDRSNNGTWVRGTRVDGAVTVTLDARPLEIAPVEGDLGSLVVRRG